MSKYNGVRLIASLMLLLTSFAFGIGTASRAYADDKSTPTTTLPQFKQPDSARFDIAGSITSTSSGLSSSSSEPTTINITGSGAISGADFEETVTYNLPATSLPGSTSTMPSSFSLEAKLVQGKYYVKISGLGGTMPGSNSDQWYVLDSSALGASAGSMSSLPNTAAFGSDYTVTEEGKETISGAATTKYKIDVDLSKELGDLGQGSSSGSGSGATSEFTVTSVYYLWIGDTDQYLYKYAMDLDLHISFELDKDNKFDSTTALDLSLTLKDINTPVTITAPDNALPFDQFLGGSSSGTTTTNTGSLTDFTNLLGMPTGMPAGMPVGMPVGMPIEMPVNAASPGNASPPYTGMPQTGSADSAPWGFLSLALASIIMGVALKAIRKPVPVKVKE